MKRIFLIISAVLVGVIILQQLFHSCSDKKKDNQIVDLQEKLVLCVNAPEVIQIDTVRDTIPGSLSIPIGKPKQIGKEIVFIHDTIPVELPQNEYTGIYEHPQFSLHWRANVTGALNGLHIDPPSLIKSLVITKTKTVNLTPNEPPGSTKKEKSHLYTAFGAQFTRKQINGTSISLMYIRKEGWGISGGIGTDFDKILYKVDLILRLK